ncbi:hypothetical protein [Actinomadura rubrisoli]|uniref:hypothetical protein n=1 Tax=Actinomadura rubrisoli TaxID=2530368 RepID=UPI001404D41A|nr:hypothetical protein [Actinomadura rubrisoli]
MIKNIATVLATAALGIAALGAAACDDDKPSAAPTASAPAASAPAAGAGSGTPAPAPVPSSPAAASPEQSPRRTPTERPKITGSQVVMIDPNGRKYTRKQMVELAAGMAAVYEKRGLPDDFCSKSYNEGIKGGGRFPAGRLAFLDACREGIRLAG